LIHFGEHKVLMLKVLNKTNLKNNFNALVEKGEYITTYYDRYKPPIIIS